MMEVSRLNTIKQRYNNGAQFAELLTANYDFDERMRNEPYQIGEGSTTERCSDSIRCTEDLRLSGHEKI